MRYQSTSTVLMIRPAHFGYNPETAESNVFQQPPVGENSSEVALAEFDAMVEVLRSEGVDVWVENDSAAPEKPDAIFPNNWLGIHPGKQLLLYPMFAKNRRLERDPALIERLLYKLPAHVLHDVSAPEAEGRFLEGTGSLIFDHVQQIVFASRSNRTEEQLVLDVAKLLGYTAYVFDALDEQGTPYYHTNVVLSIGTRFAVLCAECIPETQRQSVIDALQKNGRAVLFITREQVRAFAGNMLEVRNSAEEYLIVLSTTAMEALQASEIAFLQQFGLLLPIEISHIERTGGGSVRCMLAEVFA